MAASIHRHILLAVLVVKPARRGSTKRALFFVRLTKGFTVPWQNGKTGNSPDPLEFPPQGRGTRCTAPEPSRLENVGVGDHRIQNVERHLLPVLARGQSEEVRALELVAQVHFELLIVVADDGRGLHLLGGPMTPLTAGCSVLSIRTIRLSFNDVKTIFSPTAVIFAEKVQTSPR